ncbi:MAG: lytic murein transglycosylase B, partial [Halieaceae bacterium]|nr:lytic murein transglycosylase B [Halieaceae bacterium]
MKPFPFLALVRRTLVLFTVLLAMPVAADYDTHAAADAFVAKMVDEHAFAPEDVRSLLAAAER